MFRHLFPVVRPTDNWKNYSIQKKCVTLQPSIECVQVILRRKMHLLIYNNVNKTFKNIIIN